MRFGQKNYVLDYGHLAFLAVVASVTIWYFFDALSVSSNVNNLLLVAPLCAFSVILCLFIVPQCIRPADEVKVEEGPEQYDPLAPKLPSERSQVIRMIALGVSLGVLVFALDIVGFDISIFLFICAGMFICGERHPVKILLYAGIATAIAVYGFRALMPYPMFTMIL